jgi:hypothetical protein
MLQLEWFAMMRNRRSGVGSNEEEYADDMAQGMGIMGDMSIGDMGKQVLYVLFRILNDWPCVSQNLMTPSFLIRKTHSPQGKCPEKGTVAILWAKIKLQESCRLFCRVPGGKMVNL